MSIVREVVQHAAIGVGVTDRAEGLSAIHRPGCAAAVWRRSLPEVQPWLDGLAPDQLPKARVILRPNELKTVVSHIWDTHSGPDRDLLVDDAGRLGEIFAELMRARHLRLRFDVITTNACRRFHIDAVTARLVCTYRGTGTQYGISTDGDEPRRVFTVPTGARILMRGTLWPEQPRSGLLHRSPPIEGTGETRLVMVLDQVDDPEEEI